MLSIGSLTAHSPKGESTMIRLIPGVGTEILAARYGEVINIIESSKSVFHLAGSWYYGSRKINSDLDLIVTPDATQFLASIGCYNIPSNYLDKLTKEVWRFGHEGNHIDFQITEEKNLQEKLAIQERIKRVNIPRALRHLQDRYRKKLMGAIWELLTEEKLVHSTIQKAENHNKDICKLCGSKGEDLVFSFYCTNPQCRNYHP